MAAKVRQAVSATLLIGTLLLLHGGSHLPPPLFPIPFEQLPPPELREPAAEGVDTVLMWELVKRYAAKYQVQDQAAKIYKVIFEESRFLDDVISEGGEYLGMCQFKSTTFQASVKAMKSLMLLPSDVRFSPFNPEHAVNVMTWMWSRGYKDHWGPTRFVERHGAPPGSGEEAFVR